MSTTPLSLESGTSEHAAASRQTDAAVSLSVEQRLEILEKKIARFENALFAAAENALANPMVSAMMPKDMKASLREIIAERNGVTEKSCV